MDIEDLCGWRKPTEREVYEIGNKVLAQNNKQIRFDSIVGATLGTLALLFVGGIIFNSETAIGVAFFMGIISGIMIAIAIAAPKHIMQCDAETSLYLHGDFKVTEVTKIDSRNYLGWIGTEALTVSDRAGNVVRGLLGPSGLDDGAKVLITYIPKDLSPTKGRIVKIFPAH